MRFWTQSLLVVLPVALALNPLAESLAFKPKDGTEQEKTLVVDLSLDVDAIRITMNGEDLGDGGMGEQEGKLAVRYDATVQDTYVKSKDGAPTELLRSFDKLKLLFDNGENGESEPENVLADFEGKSVRFAWDDEKKEIKKTFHECEGDEDSLAALDVDMDALALLPSKAVAKDDTWDASGAGLARVFFPGGVFVNAEGQAAKSTGQLVSELQKYFGAASVKCTFKEKREVGGVEVGEVTLVFEHTGELALDEILKDAVELGGIGDAPNVETSAKLVAKGTGTLLWNLGSGRLHSLEMEAEMDLDLNLKAGVEMQGQSLDLEMAIEASGTGTWKLDAN